MLVPNLTTAWSSKLDKYAKLVIQSNVDINELVLMLSEHDENVVMEAIAQRYEMLRQITTRKAGKVRVYPLISFPFPQYKNGQQKFTKFDAITTPTDMMRFLLASRFNRTIAPAWIKQLKNMVEDGCWGECRDSIMVARNGFMVNCAHRGYMQLWTGKTFQFDITWNAYADDKVINQDMGKSRTPSDLIEIYKNQPLAEMVGSITNAIEYGYNNSQKYHPHALLAIYKKYHIGIDLAANMFDKGKKTQFQSVGAAFARAIMQGADLLMLEQAAKLIMTPIGVTSLNDNVILGLANYLKNAKGRNSANRKRVFQVTCYAIKCYCNREGEDGLNLGKVPFVKEIYPLPTEAQLAKLEEKFGNVEELILV